MQTFFFFIMTSNELEVMNKIKMPLTFFFRRIHSLIGLFLVLFLFEHFITNSQASYLLNEGNGFVKMVNLLQSIPFLPVIEVALIGIPIFFHAMMGITYITSSENNAKVTDGTKPSLLFPRNRAYNLQRITAYIVVILVIFHVVQVRFIKHPKQIYINNQSYFLVKIEEDKKLYKIIERMEAKLFSKDEQIANEQIALIVNKYKLKDKQLVAMTKKSGQAFLLSIRDILKNPFMVGIYTIFVLTASFHAINGLWTFLITWGFIISNRSQKISLSICYWILLCVLTLGFISVWSSFLY